VAGAEREDLRVTPTPVPTLYSLADDQTRAAALLPEVAVGLLLRMAQLQTALRLRALAARSGGVPATAGNPDEGMGTLSPSIMHLMSMMFGIPGWFGDGRTALRTAA